MAEHTRKLHFKDSGDAEHTAKLYTTYGEVVPPEIQLNADGTTGGITLYTTGADTNYPALRVVDGNDTVFGALVDPLDGRASNLHCEYDGTEYAVAQTTSWVGPIGMCLVQTGGGSGTWHMIDGDGNRITDPLDFDNIYPWSGIRDETVDGQAMVYIPKFYVKTGTFTSGTYSGKKYWLVSPTQREGYHIHPAFVHNSQGMNGFYIGKYFAWSDNNNAGSAAGKTAWVNISNTDAKAKCSARNDGSASGAKAGWHLKTIYEWAAIQLLCLIETGTPNVQTAIAIGTTTTSGGSNAKWRGICDIWNCYFEHLDGVYTDSNNKIFIFNNTNNGTYINTGLSSVGGWIKDVADTKGINFDCSDIFIPQTITSSESDATFSDYAWGGSGNCVVYSCSSADSGSQGGLFTWYNGENASHTYRNLSFRLAKYDV